MHVHVIVYVIGLACEEVGREWHGQSGGGSEQRRLGQIWLEEIAQKTQTCQGCEFEGRKQMM